MWTEAEEHGRRAAPEDGGDSRAHPHEDEDIDGARIRYIYIIELLHVVTTRDRQAKARTTSYIDATLA